MVGAIVSEMRKERSGRGAWRRLRLVPLVLGALAAAACGGDSERGGEVAANGWSPVTEAVSGVPVAELQTALRARLDGEAARPAAIGDHAWRRVRQLYDAYGQAPLFLGADGLDARARALVAAVTRGEQEALMLDRYPLAELHAALRGVREGDPTAETLADADLMLTATYVAYAEDMLTGQLDPRQLSESWHIDPNTVDVDSAVARLLREARFDQALTRLRPADEGYELIIG